MGRWKDLSMHERASLNPTLFLSTCKKKFHLFEICYATKYFNIFSPPWEASGWAIVLISQRLDRVKMSPRDVLRIPPRASRYFSGILGEYLSRSFCLTTTPLAGAATQSEGRNPLAPNARRVSASLGMILYKDGWFMTQALANIQQEYTRNGGYE